MDSSRDKCKIGFEQSFKLDQGLFIESDEIQLSGRDARRLQTILNCIHWKRGVVLFSREALFLGGGDDAAILNDRRSAVMIEGGNP